jgi:hypothetical protein
VLFLPSLLAGLILYGLLGRISSFIDEEDDAIVVELYGQCLIGQLEFLGEDNVLGKASGGIASKELYYG